MAYLLSSFAGAGAQFFDDNGSPLTGGLLYTYFAGTTTPATMYTDATGTNAHTNPIVLDAAGRTPSEVWVDGGLVYKFILKDSADVLIGTYDNIPGIDDPTVFNNLISVIGTNTLTGTATPPINGYVAGATYSFVVPNTNTGAVTISIDGLGAKEITYAGSTVLIPGQLVANSIAVIEYDGTRFQLMQSSASIATVASLNVTNNATIGGNTSVGGNLTVTGSSFSVGGNNISAVNSLGFRNRIINGDMRIDQRNDGASVATSSGVSVYTLDRWQAVYSQVNKFTVQQNAGSVTPPAGFTNYLGITSLSAYTVGASELFNIVHNIEGYNAADLGWGAAGAQTITLSFWVRSSLTGTFGVVLNNSAGTRSYPASYTISAANTWEYKTITISGDTSGTWLTNNNLGLQVRFGLGVGASVSGAAGSWSGSSFYGTTGAVSVVGTNGATFYITGVQLEAGSVATPFERRDYGRELMMCQRYYEKSYDISTAPGTSLGSSVGAVASTGLVTAPNSSRAKAIQPFKVQKRATPSLRYWDEAGNASAYTASDNALGFVANNVTTDAFRGVAASTSVIYWQCDSTASANPGCSAVQWDASAEL